MSRKWGTLVLTLLAVPSLVFAQNTGKLAGQLMDYETGDPLPGASIVLVGTQIGTISDVDGNYFIIGVPVGLYDVQASFVGFQTQTVAGVEISAGYTRELNFTLEPGIELDEIVVEYERPLIQKDAIGAPKTLTAEEINNLPVRGVSNLAALSAGVVSDENSNNLYVRGGREQQVSYYVDGVKIINGTNSLGVPNQAIAEQELLVGSIPARYGDAQSGIISITTKSGASSLFGSLEGIQSVDGYGYTLFSGTLGGPLLGNKLSFFLSGEGNLQKDSTPYMIETNELTDAAFNAMLANPQVLQYRDAEGNLGYATLPLELTPGTLDEIAAQLSDLPEGAELTTGQPLERGNFMTASDFDLVKSKERPDTQIDVTGNLTFRPTSAMSFRVGGAFAQNDWETYDYRASLYARNGFEEYLQRNWRAFGNFSHRLGGGNTFYQIQGEYVNDETWQNPTGFSRNLEDQIYYGDLDDARNSTLAAYRRVQNQGDTLFTYVANPSFEDGSRTLARAVGPSTFWLPGFGYDNYGHGSTELLRFSGHFTTQLGVHQLEFGGEFEQQTRRLYQNNSAALLARYIDDGNPEVGDGVAGYSDIPFSAFNQTATWYGYDFRGINEVDSQDIAAYVEAGTEDSPNFNAAAKNVAPWKPVYYAGYISDKIEYRDLVLNIGVRVDVFDNNVPVLVDDLALAPLVRAGALEAGSLPSNVGSDWAVYFSDEDVVGFHDLDGNFYDENGQDYTYLELKADGGRPRQVEGTSSFSPEIFEEYDPQVTFMPRIGVSFPITDKALFFASYNVTSQRPSEFAFLPFNGYEAITGQNRINNPKLKPEKTTQYELGFRQTLTARSALQISAFYRTQENLIQVRDVPEAFPGGYQGFRNIDFAATKGFEFEFDLRRTNNIAIRANYTLAFSEGTGSDAQSLGVIAWRSSMSGYSPNFLSPTDFDQRHRLNVSVDYRLGEGAGPTILGTKLLQNFGFNITAGAGSGLPYTRLQPNPLIITNSFTPDVLGGINEGRTPWTSSVNLRVDKGFMLGGANLTAFLWIENLLNSQNVLGVYRVTGLPDKDGFIDSKSGRDNTATTATVAGDPLAGESYAFNYSRYSNAPVNIGGNHSSVFGPYGLPRRTRLGLRLNF